MLLSFNTLIFAKKYLGFISDKKKFEWWPPYWMMRLKVLELSNDWRRVRIILPLTWISKNMGGGMFGGFQASLADPIAPLACGQIFEEYHVWTRKLSMDFQKAGTSDLELRFDFPLEKENEIREELKTKHRSTPTFEYGLYNTDGELCTKIECVVAIREKGYLAKPKKPSKVIKP
ncbi:MAG TPA: PaaI family thioesterase [Leucothrix mucor]|nr:PaaI family thioesterase [Leucothrix mucor]